MKQVRSIRAAMIGNSMSMFPRQLCAQWRKRGVDVTLFTRVVGGPKMLPDGTPVVEVITPGKWKPWNHKWREYAAKLDEWIARRYFSHYRERTGLGIPNAWEWQFAPNLVEGIQVGRAVREFRPDFVFAQEVHSYGFAAASCGSIPQFLFPWGADVFWCPELSPLISWMVGHSLRRAACIMPTSRFGADHIVRRFGVPRENVRPISWGVDLSMFQPADDQRRRRICAKWHLPAGKRILLNVRRLRPQWGSLKVFEAFMCLAKEVTDAHFVLLGGEGTEEVARSCREQLVARQMLDRFTLVPGQIPLDEVAELMSVAAVYTSVMGNGDMRSFSVIQAAAAGGAPIIGRHPEYEYMQQQGFSTLFAQQQDVQSIFNAGLTYLRDESLRARTVSANLAYVRHHENFDVQMDALLNTILHKIGVPVAGSKTRNLVNTVALGA
jgi:glycosyltransferase involved in cell wall biosynthesis